MSSVGELLRLLKERDEALSGRKGNRNSGDALFVAQMVDRRPSNYVFEMVRRYVVAAFAYETHRVSYTRITSNAVELPEMVARIEVRQQEAYEDIRGEIGRRLKDSELRVAVRDGHPRHPSGRGRV